MRLKNLLLLSSLLLGTANTFAATLPDFNQYKNVKEKKVQFFTYLKPMAEKSNQIILRQREKLLGLQKQKTISSSDQQWLGKLSKTYNVSTHQSSQSQVSELIDKVDVIPTSLLLAQAANESAWGTSRFAKQGNNLFGQWCYTKNCGIVPNKRGAGMHHEVKKFSSAYESIKAYELNLNSSAHYKNLRLIRHQLRNSNQKITGVALAKGLAKYSERGNSYVQDITRMINSNHLQDWD